MSKKIILKIGAYTILVVGVALFAALLLVGVILLVSYPDASLSKKVITMGGIVIAGAIIFLIALSLFESLLEVVKLEDEVTEIINHEKDSNYFMREDG